MKIERPNFAIQVALRFRVKVNMNEKPNLIEIYILYRINGRELFSSNSSIHLYPLNYENYHLWLFLSSTTITVHKKAIEIKTICSQGPQKDLNSIN